MVMVVTALSAKVSGDRLCFRKDLDKAMLTTLEQFRSRHPLGGVITELLRVEQGLYVVRAQISVDKNTLGSGLAVCESLETAEEQAIQRALATAGFGETRPVEEPLRRAAPPAPLYPVEDVPRRNGAVPIPTPVYEAEEEEAFMDLSELIAATDVELKRIGWDSQQGKAYLSRTHGKATRRQLNEEELRDFLRYLKTQPTALNRRPQETPF